MRRSRSRRYPRLSVQRILDTDAAHIRHQDRLSLARIPWLTWAKWMVPLQLIYVVLSLAMLVPPCLM
jgi:hypothetical protein